MHVAKIVVLSITPQPLADVLCIQACVAMEKIAQKTKTMFDNFP